VTIAAVTLALLAGVAAAWWFESHTPSAGTSAHPAGAAASTAATPAAAPSGYAVKVTRDGRLLASYDLAQLEAIGMKQVVLQGGTEQGPPLLSVLDRASVGSFTSVTILGTGVKDSGRLVLASSEIGPDTVLDIAKRGTVKVAGPNIPYDQRVRDITEIQVR
jgi:hypothetical protein